MSKHLAHPLLKRSFLLLWLSLFWVCLGWFIRRFNVAITYLDFGPESEKYLAAILLNQKNKLYQSVVVEDGPLNYLIATVINSLTGTWDISVYRTFFIVLYALPILAVYFSPLFTELRQRLLSTALFMALLATLAPAWLGQALIYQNVAGLLLVVLLAQYLLPLLLGIKPRPGNAMLAGASYGFCAVTTTSYLISMVMGLLLIIYALWRQQPNVDALVRSMSRFLGAAVAAVALVRSWLWFYDDILIQVSAPTAVSGLAPLTGLLTLDNIASPQAIPLYLTAILVLLSLPLLYSHLCRILRWPTTVAVVIGLLGFLLYTNPYWLASYHAATFCLLALAWFALMMGLAVTAAPWQRYSAIGLWLVCLLSGWYAYYQSLTPQLTHINIGALSANQLPKSPNGSDFASVINALSSATEPMAAYAFLPSQYLFAQRLPASGQFYYLPRHSNDSVRADVCADLNQQRPRFFVLDRRTAGNSDPFEDYAACMIDFLTKHYTLIKPQSPYLYLRRDLMTTVIPQLTAAGHPPYPAKPLKSITSTPGDELLNGDIVQTTLAVPAKATLLAVQIRLTNYGRSNSGFMDIELHDSSGQRLGRRQILNAEVEDDEFFTVPLTAPAKPKQLKVTLRAYASTPGDAISVMLSPNAQTNYQRNGKSHQGALCLNLLLEGWRLHSEAFCR